MELTTEIYKAIATKGYGAEIANDLFFFFEKINKAFYDDSLPPALITFEILAYGACIGLTHADRGHIKLKKPKAGERLKITPAVVGVLVHEVIHYARPYVETKKQKSGKKSSSETSHNCQYWIQEINRIHQQFTGEKLGAGLQVLKRVEVQAEKKDKAGKVIQKRVTKPKRTDTGSITRKQISTYPHSLEISDRLYKYLKDF